MPKIDRKLILKKVDVIADLKKIIKAENILDHEDQIRPFETDALSAYKQKPLAVVFPKNTKEVSEILAYCNREKIKLFQEVPAQDYQVAHYHWKMVYFYA